jgi:hypothetical protein
MNPFSDSFDRMINETEESLKLKISQCEEDLEFLDPVRNKKDVEESTARLNMYKRKLRLKKLYKK